MVRVSDVITYVEGLTGHRLNRDEGVHFGAAESQVRTLVVCWMATQRALDHAGGIDADLLIGHESLYYPYDAAVNDRNPRGWQDWPVNRQRRELLKANGLTFLRLHGSLDEICIFDDFRRQLGLPEAAASGSTYYAKRFDITPCTLAKLTVEFYENRCPWQWA